MDEQMREVLLDIALALDELNRARQEDVVAAVERIYEAIEFIDYDEAK